MIPDEDTRSGTRAARELPVSEAQARKATRWVMENFGELIQCKTAGTPFTPALLTAMICQESALYWLQMLSVLEKRPEYANDPDELRDELLGRCVLDASGDFPGNPRSAFPKILPPSAPSMEGN